MQRGRAWDPREQGPSGHERAWTVGSGLSPVNTRTGCRAELLRQQYELPAEEESFSDRPAVDPKHQPQDYPSEFKQVSSSLCSAEWPQTSTAQWL